MPANDILNYDIQISEKPTNDNAMLMAVKKSLNHQ